MQTQRSHVWLVLFSTLIPGVCLLLTLPLSAAPSGSPGVSPNIVINQIYGGGGGTGATFKNSFLELFNKSIATVDVSNWSVQYASDTGGKWLVTRLSGTISDGHYFLVQEAQGAGGWATLPPPDAIGAIALSASSGKVALVNNRTPIPTGTLCPSGPGIVDFVGYGTANCYESQPAPAPNNTLAAIRIAGGCIDTDDNASDFSLGTPNPRNSSYPAHLCGVPATPTGTPTGTTTVTDTRTAAETSTSALTQTPTATGTPTETSTYTPSGTSVLALTPTSTGTSTPIHSLTATESPTPSFTPTPGATSTELLTSTNTVTRTGTRTRKPTNTRTATPTATPTLTYTPAATGVTNRVNL